MQQLTSYQHRRGVQIHPPQPTKLLNRIAFDLLEGFAVFSLGHILDTESRPTWQRRRSRRR
jgi:hypothetical protein